MLVGRTFTKEEAKAIWTMLAPCFVSSGFRPFKMKNKKTKGCGKKYIGKDCEDEDVVYTCTGTVFNSTFLCPECQSQQDKPINSVKELIEDLKSDGSYVAVIDKDADTDFNLKDKECNILVNEQKKQPQVCLDEHENLIVEIGEEISFEKGFFTEDVAEFIRRLKKELYAYGPTWEYCDIKKHIDALSGGIDNQD